MKIPDQTLDGIVCHFLDAYDLDFTRDEIQEICDEAEISEDIASGWPDTEERGLFMDALAAKFANREWWPGNQDDDDDFALDLIVGFFRWRFGHLSPGDFVLYNNTPFQVKATSFTRPEEIVPGGTAVTWVELQGHDGRVGLNSIRRDMDPPFQIESNGKTVWINDRQGTCLGRFSRFGIDIHNNMLGQMVGVQCLDCKPAKSVTSGMTFADWQRFKEGMFRFHNVLVTDRHMPEYLR